MDEFRPLTQPDDVDGALGQDVAVVYKHSPVCNLSTVSLREVKRFIEAHPSVPVYFIDVIAHRDVSNRVADLTGIRHHSPQAIVFRSGRPVWDGDHFDVTAEALSRAMDS
jgi:bacillithiol system protein YtxJ